MKTNRILSFLLFIVLSLQVTHAFVIDEFDTHKCQVKEYVKEFSQSLNSDINGDICKIHFEFHLAFILPEPLITSKQEYKEKDLYSRINEYDFISYDNTIKPPINL